MKRIFFLIILFSSIISAQKIAPILWKLSGTTLSPTNSNWLLPSTLVGLGNVTNNAQIKKAISSTNGMIPKWNGTTGDALIDGYTVGVAANNILQLDSSGKIPAVDGSQITGLAQTKISLSQDTTDYVTNSTTYIDVPNYSDSVIAGKRYSINLLLHSVTSGANEYIQFIFPNASIIGGVGILWDGTAFSTFTKIRSVSNGLVIVNNLTAATLTANFIINIKYSGRLKLQIKASSSAGTVTLGKTSFYVLTEL